MAMVERNNARELAKGLVGEIADGCRVAVETDDRLDPYQRANVRVGIAVGQLLASLAVDAVADWAEEE